MTEIEQYLRQTIGLDSASIGPALIERTVRLRMKSHGIKRFEEYKRLLLSSEAEHEQLMEAVVVTETWFFRDQHPFSAFVRIVQEEWLPSHAAGPFRVLSVPCATGEEPFSLAIALLEAGVPSERFEIEAVDLSANAIARARRAVFKKNSFRGKDLAFRDRNFRLTREGYALSPSVQGCVRFFQGNLLDEDFLSKRPSYDFIFCRNLLIYFDRPTQRKALARIDRLLSPSGSLWVGAAEHPLVTEAGFVSAQIPMAFACRKAASQPEQTLMPNRAPRGARRASRGRNTALEQLQLKPATGKKPGLEPGGLAHAAPRNLPAALGGGGVSASSGPVGTDGSPSLKMAMSLADAGRFGEAEEICSQLLQRDGASADLYYLLGLVRDATDKPGGSEFYRKALYLDPHHYATLLQMSLLCEQAGDFARSRSYRSRADRVKQKESPEL